MYVATVLKSITGFDNVYTNNPTIQITNKRKTLTLFTATGSAESDESSGFACCT